GLAVLQWLVGSRVPLDPDESYYWEWSRRLALGYYDHPPAIAYLIRAGTAIFGPTTLGVRFVPVLANLGGGLMMLLIARRLAGPGPYLACLLAALIVVPTVVGNPSAPLAFQLRHGFGGSHGSPLLQELDFIGGQMAFAGGILFVLLAIAVAGSLRRSAEPLRFVLAVVAFSTQAVFAVSSLRHRVEANWPLPAYMPAVVLLASAPGGPRRRRWVRAGI